MAKNTILIVEDEAILAADLSERLEKTGHQVVGIVATGRQALRIIDEMPPDIVLMDIKIQGDMDGIETAEVIHAETGIPVIFLTAFSNESLLDKAKRTEPFAYLVKPVQNSQLMASIEMTLYKSKMEAERAQLTKELNEALSEIKTLRGILPICSYCKKIRNDQGYWDQIEEYMETHTEIKFSHGICQECAEKYFPGMNLYGDDKN